MLACRIFCFRKMIFCYILVSFSLFPTQHYIFRIHSQWDNIHTHINFSIFDCCMLYCYMFPLYELPNPTSNCFDYHPYPCPPMDLWESPCGHTKKRDCFVRGSVLLCYFSERLYLLTLPPLIYKGFHFPIYFLKISVTEHLKISLSF